MTCKLIGTLAAFTILTTSASAHPLQTVASELGEIVASAKSGLTLYTSLRDTQNGSKCYDTCARAWPPFIAAASETPDGPLDIIDRADGTRQWTLNGRPLYFWVGDMAVGDVTGDGVGGVWDAVRN